MTSRAFPPGFPAKAPSREQGSTRRWLRLLRLAIGAGLLWFGAAILYHATRPEFGPATLLLPGEAPRPFIYPFHLQDAPRTKFVLIQQLALPRFHPTIFTFYPQDFLWDLRVNGQEVRAPGLPLAAASHEGRSINLGAVLHPGVNVIELQMEARWSEASFRLAVSPWDRYELALLALIAGATCATAASFSTFHGAGIPWPERWILLAGVGLRYIYVFGTPYYIRSFDYWGHADYLDYVARHFRLPPSGQNWEAFQPPLYYFVVGGVTRLLLLLGMAEDQRYVLWQGVSVLISLGVLATGWVLARFLYEEGDGRRLYMLAIFAVAPPLVFNAARISNDGLIALLSMVWLASLLRYWSRPSRPRLSWLAVVLGLALLTKANAISLVLVSAVCLLADPRFGIKSRMASLSLMLALSGVIAGGYYVPRAFHAHDVSTYVVGNLHSLSNRAEIKDVFAKSLVFNPFKVVRYPFDESWGPRNDHFLEVFFKTMLLGEWIAGASYKFLARWMVIIAMLLIPIFAVGLWQAIRRRASGEEPLLASLTCVFVAQWLFLQCAPYLSTQDFRYSVVLLVPLAWFLLNGVYTSACHIRSIATLLLQVALLNSAIYLVVLAM